MATTNGIIVGGMSGALGNQVVFKQYGNRTVASKYPDMSNIKPSILQKENRNLFKEAHVYAQSINNNPTKKAAYKKKLKKGELVYFTALSEYMKNNK